MNEPVVACVPNFSEGRDPATINALIAAMHLPGVYLLDCTSSPEANRSVVTIAGKPAAVFEAAVRASGVAVERIDLITQRGSYPRMGAIDVLPFVPVSGMHIAECALLAREAAVVLWDRFRLPCYLYEAAATRPDRVSLDQVRAGQFEGLRDAVLRDAGRRPDMGGPGLHPSAGAAAVGARRPLIECRLTVATDKLASARAIARALREGSHGMQAAACLSSTGAQVLVKIADYREIGIAQMHERACTAAHAAGTHIAAGELIGLIPEGAWQPGSAWTENLWADASPIGQADRARGEQDQQKGGSAFPQIKRLREQMHSMQEQILERRLLCPLPWPAPGERHR